MDNFLETLLPSVFINSIFLENTARSKFDERDPHIDHEREPGIVKDPISGRLEVQIITPDMAKKSAASDMLIVSLNLLVKEKLHNDFLTSWIENDDLLKYLSVYVFQSTNEKLTEELVTKQLEIDIDGLKRINELYAASFDLETIKLKDVIRKSGESRQSSLSDVVLSQYESYNDENGNRIIDVDFRIKFNIRNATPKHLSYFVFSFLDIEQMVKDYQMNLPFGKLTPLKGKEVVEIVIDDFNVVSESFIFVDETGAVWDGATHRTEDGGWRTGKKDDEDSKILQLKTVSNVKIQDFRSVRELEKLNLDFSFIENDAFLMNPIKILSSDKTDVGRKDNYFSSFALSRDSLNRCRFLFGVDFVKMAKEKTVFGKLYKNDNVELLKNVKIRELKIYRVRLPNNYNTAIVNNEGVSFFDESKDVPELISFSSENRSGIFVKNTYKEFLINLYKDVGTVREVGLSLEQGGSGVRHFTVIDKGMENVTFGFYKYLITLEIEDNTSKLLTDKLDNLLESYKLLTEYYNEIEHGIWTASKAGSSLDNFNPYTGHFTMPFIEAQEKKYKDEPNMRIIPWVFPITSYLSTVSIFSDNFDSEKYSKILLSVIHPRTGTMDGILTFLKLLETLIRKVSVLVESTVSGKVTKLSAGSSFSIPSTVFSRGKAPVKTFTIRGYSDFVFDSDVPKKTGYDFFSLSGQLEKETNDDGLLVISKEQYEKRTELEVLKYFKNTDVDINLKTANFVYTQDDSLKTTKCSFLTPSNMNLGIDVKASFVKQGEDLFNVEKYGNILTNVVKFNSLRHSPQITFRMPNLSNVGYSSTNKGITFKELVVTKNFDDIASGFGAVMQSAPASSKGNVSPYEDNVKKEIQNEIAGQISGSSVSNVLISKKKSNVSEEQKSVYLLDAKGFIGAGSNFNKEDAVKEEYKESALFGKIKEQKEVNVKTNSFMSMVFAPLVKGGVNSSLNVGKLKNDRMKIKNTIDFFDLNKSGNALNSFSFAAGVKSDGLVSSDVGIADIKKQDYIKALPYQVKSLFLSSVSAEKVNKNWFSMIARANIMGLDGLTAVRKLPDPLKDPNDSLLFNLNYGLIKEVEVFVGYKVDRNSSFIKEQVWKRLTKEELEKAKNGNLLCRLKTYVNKEMNVEPPKGLELPIYNEYFVLSIENKFVTIEAIRFKSQEERMAESINLSSQQFFIMPKKQVVNTVAMVMIPKAIVEKPIKAVFLTPKPIIEKPIMATLMSPKPIVNEQIKATTMPKKEDFKINLGFSIMPKPKR